MSREYGPHVIQYSKEYSLCAGCSTCEIVCALTHDEVVGPRYNRIFLDRHDKSQIHTILACMHCSDHPCFDACPEEGAMIVDEENVVIIQEEFCTGCGRCMKACVFTPSRINLVRSKDAALRKAKKCDLCKDREEGPACIEWCPVRCIGMSNQPQPTLEAPEQTLPPGALVSVNTSDSTDQIQEA